MARQMANSKARESHSDAGESLEISPGTSLRAQPRAKHNSVQRKENNSPIGEIGVKSPTYSYSHSHGIVFTLERKQSVGVAL